MKLFSGSAQTYLTEEVARILDIPISKSEVIRYSNSEVKVTIQEDVRNETCVIIQPTANPTDTNLLELIFFCDALRREEAKQVIGIIPYFGYAKQNIQHRAGECVSVNVVIKLLESIGFSKIYTFDLHDEATAGVFTIPFKNISAFPFLADMIKKEFLGEGIDLKDVALVSPDQGAVEKVRHFGTQFFGTPNFHEVVIEKQRDQNVKETVQPLDLYGDVKNKIVLIVDDMVVTGGTTVEAVNLCLEKGAKKVYTAAIHHDLSEKAPAKLQNSRMEKFFTTNTTPLRKEYQFAKMREFTIAPLIADELKYFFKKGTSRRVQV